MNEHFAAAEADFQRYYGLDLRTALWGADSVGCRRLWSLFKWMPQEAAFHRSADPEAAHWTLEVEMGASLIELTDAMWKAWFKANAPKGKGSRIPKVIHIPRPWDGKRRPALSSGAEIDAALKAAFGE